MSGDWRTELADLAEGRLTPTYDRELIVQTAPTRTLIASGCVLEHGIVAANDQGGWVKRPLRVGASDVGWAYVQDGIGGNQRVAANAMQGLEKANWMLTVQDATYFPVTSWEKLPAVMHLSQYDVGHELVFTRSELMGRTATVQAVGHRYTTPPGDEKVLTVKMREGNPVTVYPDAVGVIVKGEAETLASIGLRYPPGSRVWVKQSVRAGEPYVWGAAVSLGWEKGALQVTMLEDGTERFVYRSEVAPGDEPAPPPSGVAPTKRGTNPVPRGKRAKRWNVPPA